MKNNKHAQKNRRTQNNPARRETRKRAVTKNIQILLSRPKICISKPRGTTNPTSRTNKEPQSNPDQKNPTEDTGVQQQRQIKKTVSPTIGGKIIE